MKNFNAIILIVIFLTGCKDTITRMFVDRGIENLGKIETFRGTVIEKGLLKNNKLHKVEIVFKKPDLFMAKTVSPSIHRGNYFGFDGKNMYIYYAYSRFGIAISGLYDVIPDTEKKRIERLRENLFLTARENDVTWEGHGKIFGRRIHRFTIKPKAKEMYRFMQYSWNDVEFSVPLKLEMKSEKRKIIYSFEYTDITFNREIPDKEFRYRFPRGTMIGRWNLRGKGYSLKSISGMMNFHLFKPSGLDKKMKLKRAIKAPGIVPSACLIYYDGKYTLIITQVKDYGLIRVRPIGIIIPSIAKNARLTFLGEYSSIFWKKRNVFISLTGNIPYYQMIDIAEKMR